MAGGVFTEHAGYVNDPQLAARNLADAARRHGAEFRWGTSVTEVKLDASGTRVNGVVLNGESVVEAPIVVNAAGKNTSAPSCCGRLAKGPGGSAPTEVSVDALFGGLGGSASNLGI